MLKYINLIILSLVTACAVKAPAATFTATQGRTVYLVGEVGRNALPLAKQIVDMAAKDTDEPIDIVINSPGGSIFAGMQILSAMQVAQARGATIRCFVPVLAASMAFAIFSQCDERYALPFSMLLWHPGKVSTSQPLSEDDLRYNADQLREIERDLNKIEIQALKIPDHAFFYHYRHETLWYGMSLNHQAPGFMQIVEDFENVNDPFGP